MSFCIFIHSTMYWTIDTCMKRGNETASLIKIYAHNNDDADTKQYTNSKNSMPSNFN